MRSSIFVLTQIVNNDEYMDIRRLWCTGVVLGDGPPRLASAFKTFCNTHMNTKTLVHTDFTRVPTYSLSSKLLNIRLGHAR